ITNGRLFSVEPKESVVASRNMILVSIPKDSISVIVTAINGQGCFYSTSLTVRHLPTPFISLATDTTLCGADSVVVPFGVDHGRLISMEPPDVVTVTDTSLTVLLNSDSLTLTLTAANELGCTT